VGISCGIPHFTSAYAFFAMLINKFKVLETKDV